MPTSPLPGLLSTVHRGQEAGAVLCWGLGVTRGWDSLSVGFLVTLARTAYFLLLEPDVGLKC